MLEKHTYFRTLDYTVYYTPNLEFAILQQFYGHKCFNDSVYDNISDHYKSYSVPLGNMSAFGR